MMTTKQDIYDREFEVSRRGGAMLAEAAAHALRAANTWEFKRPDPEPITGLERVRLIYEGAIAIRAGSMITSLDENGRATEWFYGIEFGDALVDAETMLRGAEEHGR